TNAQVDDLVLRLAEKAPDLPVGRLHSSDADPYDKALDAPDNARKSAKAADLAGLDVVISTAATGAPVKGVAPRGHAIVDEAYQMRADALLAVANLFERALFVGDPGQLDPFSIVGGDQWAGLSYDPSASAVTTLLAHNPDLPQHRLPVSWRLPAAAAPLVSDAFYPYTPFRSGTDHGDRALAFTVPSDGSGPDRVIDEAAESGWGLLQLPAAHTPRTDPEAVRAVALVVRRLLDREGTATSERSPDPTPLTADRIAVGTAHRDQAAAVRSALAALVVTDVVVRTASLPQDGELDTLVVLLRLSVRPGASAFDPASGRLCGVSSGHRHACIAVCREGVVDFLGAYPSTEPVQL